MYQKQTERMLADGGVMQEGGTVDEASGNEVPAGSLKEEVRDDVDAKLSVGEFVVPADVVRYIGLENLMKMRDKAKAGLKQMSDIGQMGNAEEAVKDEEDIGEFSSAVDDVMGEEDSSTANKEDGVKKMALGGYVQPENATTYANAPLKGFEMVSLVNDAGNVVYIPYINGKPQLSIPAGYKVKTGAIDTSASTVAPVTTTAVSAPTPAPTGEYGSGSKYGDNISTPTPTSPTSDGMVSGTSPEDIGMLGKGLGMLGFGLPGMAMQLGKGVLSSASTSLATSQNQATVAAQLGLTPEEASSPAGRSAIASVIDSSPMRGEDIGVTATTGPSGTGAAATAAGAAAAEAATNAGYSSSAISAGAQAAASATLSGATPAAAANVGGAAAAAAQAIADSVAANTTTTETPASSGYGSGVSSYGSGSIGSQNSTGSSSAFGGGFGSGESSSSGGYGG